MKKLFIAMSVLFLISSSALADVEFEYKNNAPADRNFYDKIFNNNLKVSIYFEYGNYLERCYLIQYYHKNPNPHSLIFKCGGDYFLTNPDSIISIEIE